MWSYFFVPVSRRAALFWTFCNLFSKGVERPVKTALKLSNFDVTWELISVAAAYWTAMYWNKIQQDLTFLSYGLFSKTIQYMYLHVTYYLYFGVYFSDSPPTHTHLSGSPNSIFSVNLSSWCCSRLRRVVTSAVSVKWRLQGLNACCLLLPFQTICVSRTISLCSLM